MKDGLTSKPADFSRPTIVTFLPSFARWSATPMPDRISIAEEVLLGKEPSEELFRLAGEKVSEEMIKRSGVRWSTPYKKPVIEALTTRAVREAVEK